MAKLTFKDYLSVFTDKRMLSTLLLGFSSGIPLALTGATLQAWLTDAKLDLGTIGVFGLVGIPYTCKFVWAPFLDRYALPFLGLRRGWGVLSQVGLALSIVALAHVNPAERLDLFSLVAFLIAFFSASQDIVVDAYRTEILPKETYGIGAGIYTAGYRIATLISGGAALVMADNLILTKHADLITANTGVEGFKPPYTPEAWKYVYITMALCCLVGAITLLASPEPKVERKNKALGIKDSIINPFLEFFQRNGAMEILLFVMIYKLSTLMATSLTTTFLMDIGYSKTLIGSVNKIAGMIASIAGTISGGVLMMNLGLKRSLWIFGIVQSLVGLTFCIMPHVAGLGEYSRVVGLATIISIDNFMMGLGTAAIMGFMMTVISKQFTGTQFALLTSLTAVSRVILTAHSGHIVEVVGWDAFFLGTIPLAIPGLLLLRHFDQWQTTSTTVTNRIGRYDLSMVGVFMVSLFALTSEPFFRWIGMKDLGNKIVLAGALGIVLVIVAGLVKPYLPAFRSPANAANRR